MQKLLLSAAIATGLIAPAIYATVGSSDMVKTEKKEIIMTQSGKSLSGTTVRKPVLSCTRTTMQEYTEAKKALTDTYRAKIQKAMKDALANTVSGEKKLAQKEVRKLQEEYRNALEELKQKYTEKQRACRIK